MLHGCAVLTENRPCLQVRMVAISYLSQHLCITKKISCFPADGISTISHWVEALLHDVYHSCSSMHATAVLTGHKMFHLS